jgi:cellulose synthase/poly-beta-1,6-N-acetylglucosamine synthase-like glycosyltransferase
MRDLDILYLTRNRLEFTRMTFGAIVDNTDWRNVKRFVWYDDGSTDGTAEYAAENIDRIPVPSVLRKTALNHPLKVMNDYLRTMQPAELFVKIDNDVMLPPHWLGESLKVMDANPELDLLGLEAFSDPVAGKTRRTYSGARFIGGIGVMRRSAFRLGLPNPYDARYGFQEWQDAMGIVIKGWLQPALPVVLLDRVPFEPYLSLTRKYIANDWARPWAFYTPEDYPWKLLKGVLVV